MRPTLPRAALLIVAALVSACGTGAAPTGSVSSPASTPATSAAPPATSAPLPTPMATSLAGTPAISISLGHGTAPIDVAFAFGSIWVAGHHRDSVFRYDPTTMQPIAQIRVGAGPGWFAVTDDAVWVSSQLGRGLSRIDPATNEETKRAGMWSTCNEPIVALGSIWQMACDAHQLMRINPVTLESIDTTITDYEGVTFLRGRLILTGPKGMADFDPGTGKITPNGGPAGWLLGSDDESVWVNDQDKQALRFYPADGRVVAIPLTFPGPMRPAGDHAWLMQQSTGVSEIDAATSAIKRSIPITLEPMAPIEAAGYLWVTTFGGDNVWRIEP